MFSRLLGKLGKKIAMDLGTANTLLYTREHGIVLNEPSVVAVDAVKNTVLAVGNEAKAYIGRTPKNIHAIRPMKDGVIADFDVTKEMISYFIRKAVTGLRFVKPSMVICVPTGITQVEKKAVIDAAFMAGVREVHLIEEPMGAAIGANLPIHEPLGNLVLDIGGGTSEVAVITMGSTAFSESVRMAGDAMDMAVLRYIHDVFQLDVGENTAENVKKILGCAVPMPNAPLLDVSGKDLVQGVPKVVRISEGHVREALRDCLRVIVKAVFTALEKTPPELAGDIYSNGLLLAGGGALLKGLDQLIAQETRLKVVVDNDPLTTVVRGTGKTLDDLERYSHLFIN